MRRLCDVCSCHEILRAQRTRVDDVLQELIASFRAHDLWDRTLMVMSTDK
jgi:hypothetical protein